MNKVKILLIGGPTAVGKSEISIRLAKILNGEIISCDSRQFYIELNIGTDKPSLETRKEIPHHLIDFISLKDEIDVCEYKNIVLEKIKEIIQNGKTPIIVGGSGFYLRTLIKGLFDLPPDLKNKQKEIRKRLENIETEVLYKKLEEIDPKIIKKIHKNDRYRIIRAIEIYELTGKNMSYWQKQNVGPTLRDIGDVYYFILLREKNEIYERIKKRVEKMLENGWINEVIMLKNKNFESYLRKKAPIGYNEILDYLDGRYTFEQLKDTIIKKTKEYARKQIIWFKKEEGIIIKFSNEEECVKKILEYLKND